MSGEADIPGLIGSIYEAVGQPELWSRFLDRFADAVGGAPTVLLLFNANARVGSVTAAVRVDPAAVEQFNQYYITIDQWAAHGHAHYIEGRVDPGQLLCPDRVLRHSEFYADFLRPLDIFEHFHGVIATDGAHASIISSSRPERMGPFSAQALDLTRLLMPHLRRALNLHRRLGALETGTRWQEDILDRLPTGTVMISAAGRMLFLNAYARRVITQGDGLKCGPEGLVAQRPSDTQRLQQLVRGAIDTTLGRGIEAGGVMRIPRPSGLRSFQLLVSPYRSTRTWPGVEQPAATVFITDPEREPEYPPALLSRLYGLTPAEARLAVLLLGGGSVAEAADQLGVTLNTARTHLKQVFAKTGTKRQAELVRLLIAGPLALVDAGA